MYRKTGCSDELHYPETILSTLGNLMILVTFSGKQESLDLVQCAAFTLCCVLFPAAGLLLGITQLKNS